MNRRDFFRRTVPAVAITVASLQSGWALSTLRRILASVLKKVEAAPATLAELYAKMHKDVLAAVRTRTEEMRWFSQYPTETITVGAGVENCIPLRMWGV